MNDGWEDSAAAWIAAMGPEGDWSRREILDPVMLARVDAAPLSEPAGRALDVGCGEGRFCRLLRRRGIEAVGVDPTRTLLAEARRRDPQGDYREGRAEALNFPAESFDLVVSYLTLIDIPDFRAAIREMVRVLRPGGHLLVANLNSFVTACAPQNWVEDEAGRPLHYPVDRYLEEFPNRVEWDGIRVQNWHRPLGAYMQAFLTCGLRLAFYAEPAPLAGEPERVAKLRRVPFFVVMEWRRAEAA